MTPVHLPLFILKWFMSVGEQKNYLENNWIKPIVSWTLSLFQDQTWISLALSTTVSTPSYLRKIKLHDTNE